MKQAFLSMDLRRYLLTGCALLSLIAASPTQAQDYGNAGGSALATNTELRLSAVEDQLRALTGKAEQVEFTVRRLDQAVARMQADYEQRLTKLETAAVQAVVPPPPPPATPTAAPSPPAVTTETGDTATGQPADTVTSVRGSLGAIRVQDGRVVGGAVSPKTPPLPDVPEGYGLTAQEQYDRAFTLLRQANYDEAEKAFKAFIEKNPKDKLIDNAKYWHAETYYVRAQFSDAAVAFADAYQENPKGSKAPDSLLKLAMSLSGLDKTADACTTLSELRKNYPQAPASIRTRADQERARLKCKP